MTPPNSRNCKAPHCRPSRPCLVTTSLPRRVVAQRSAASRPFPPFANALPGSNGAALARVFRRRARAAGGRGGVRRRALDPSVVARSAPGARPPLRRIRGSEPVRGRRGPREEQSDGAQGRQGRQTRAQGRQGRQTRVQGRQGHEVQATDSHLEPKLETGETSPAPLTATPGCHRYDDAHRTGLVFWNDRFPPLSGVDRSHGKIRPTRLLSSAFLALTSHAPSTTFVLSRAPRHHLPCSPPHRRR